MFPRGHASSFPATLLAVVAAATSAANATTIEYRTVVVTGDQVPGEDEGVTFRWIGAPPTTGPDAPRIDGLGNVGFVAGWGDNVFEPHGVLRERDGALEVIAQRGDLAPGVDLPFDFFPSIAPASPRAAPYPRA